MSFADVDATVKEIFWAKENGLVGVVLPAMSETGRVRPRFELAWSALEKTGLPACTHTAISSIRAAPR